MGDFLYASLHKCYYEHLSVLSDVLSQFFIRDSWGGWTYQPHSEFFQLSAVMLFSHSYHSTQHVVKIQQYQDIHYRCSFFCLMAQPIQPCQTSITLLLNSFYVFSPVLPTPQIHGHSLWATVAHSISQPLPFLLICISPSYKLVLKPGSGNIAPSIHCNNPGLLSHSHVCKWV